jgi:3'-5' exoribonuclease Rv2179c-like domain
MIHAMVDIETFGVRPGYAIRSIAALQFDLDGRKGREFYANISLASCEERGLLVDPATLRWWAEQSEGARAKLEINQRPLLDVLAEFNVWWDQVGVQKIWGQGAAFDPVLIEAAMEKCSLRPHWKFWNVRDTRTTYELAELDTRDVKRAGIHHHGTDDCAYQVDCVAEAVRRLKRRGDGGFGNKFDSLTMGSFF